MFHVADDDGAILLFDESDVLFGKHSAVKDSHDRYTNIESNVLLHLIDAGTVAMLLLLAAARDE